MRDRTRRGTTGRQTATRAGLEGAQHPDDPSGGISWRTAVRRVGEAAAADTVNHQKICNFKPFFGHFRPPHSSFPPFLDPLNSFPWSLFAGSSLFGSYNENKIGRRLDRVFQPPQQLLDQGNGTNEFLVSWAFH